MHKFLALGLLPYLLGLLNGTRLTFIANDESDTAIALTQIIRGLQPHSLTILALPSKDVTDGVCQNDRSVYLDDFLHRLHRSSYKSVVFSKAELFFQYIEENLQGANECISLILEEPKQLLNSLHDRHLAHRLSLFIFFWGARFPPSPRVISFKEPLRAVVLTRPRKKAFRIYYNQARPCSDSQLQLVNWYDGDNLGLQRIPLLPTALSVYANFQGRIFRVPVFHSPPWFWVTYCNYSSEEDEELNNLDSIEKRKVWVTGGRDHRLLTLLSKEMNFRFKYIEAPGRTQGSIRSENDRDLNDSFTGGIGLLQSGQLADFFLGDVGLSWERRKAIEFSFFTLADSGAFATHAPRRLNEALAIMRPFKQDIWPHLILTIIFSGPIFYVIIALPYIWRRRRVNSDVEHLGELYFHITYLKEITPHLLKFKPGTVLAAHQMPHQLFQKCIWFALRLFLKQSCNELHNGYRAKFLTIVYWIAATYVLADVYSAQLTSQFARPAREPPINTLQSLQAAMIHDGYRLYVEKESSSLEMLENGTELFRQLYSLMRQQVLNDPQGFFIDSVEAGIKLIAEGGEDKAVLGGRETLFFNVQQYGSKNFQLSQKLYTRYSAVAVQIGCPFLGSLNKVLMQLFESGILDKMTAAEYAKQYQEAAATTIDKGKVQAKSSEACSRTESYDSTVISPLNLRMLQGAFIALGVGALAAGLVLLLETVFIKLDQARLWILSTRMQWIRHDREV
ncbi:ionotropic receptor 40a isoform X3 [Drosophila santomea]|uniref:ionotropic receptor 40a isoform X3 n=1 Tax=Drosophila santomea TaxID=129105 RepID=UPI00195328FB|nr:ionotropic receptor 40a isoform X3 [Drosophila santomea]